MNPLEKEEKILEVALDALILRCQDLKNSLTAAIYKLENEWDASKWPSALDSFALLSGQISNLMKVIRNDKTPSLRNRVLLPLLLAPDRDEELAKLTEGRVVAFNHEMVPDYLRTKLEPEVESRESTLTLRANQIQADIGQKQIVSINKIANNLLELVKTGRDEWETESNQRAQISQTSSLADTQTLIAAITYGKGLKDMHSPKGGPTVPQSPQANMPQQNMVAQRPAPGKAPSAIKTNIKAAPAPYSR